MDAFVALRGQDALARMMGLVPGKPTGTVKTKVNEGGKRTATARTKVADEKREKCMDALRRLGPLSQMELANAAGISKRSANYCLSVLRQQGRVEKVEALKRQNNKWKLVESDKLDG
ncbi:MAG: hypothetical protein EP341_09715 [Sphingomonadales bacterium]|nr:MAG: hypothetical protein EP341_09715 [Sphingomonadales bacterium]